VPPHDRRQQRATSPGIGRRAPPSDPNRAAGPGGVPQAASMAVPLGAGQSAQHAMRLARLPGRDVTRRCIECHQVMAEASPVGA
jgi:hypothetical protein